jgi:hypothetical protein
MKTVEARRNLLNDIQNFHSVEVNSDYLLSEVFNDVLITEWCHAVGVTYLVNLKPDPSFKSKSTIIFQDILCKDESL